MPIEGEPRRRSRQPAGLAGPDRARADRCGPRRRRHEGGGPRGANNGTASHA